MRTIEARARNAATITLAVVIAALVLVMMAIPVQRRSRADVESQRLTTELQLTLDEMRTTIAEFAASHGHFPGAGPSRHADPFWVEHQLDIALRRSSENAASSGGTTFGSSASESAERSDGLATADGSFGAIRARRRSLRADAPVLENPLNRRSNVRFLSSSDPWPLEGDDSSGWLYRPATGEIRANSPGTSPWSGIRFLDM